MHRAHELIAKMQVDSEDYKDCIASVKFDLGDLASFVDVAESIDLNPANYGESRLNLPAPVALYQVRSGSDCHLLLVKEFEGEMTFRRFSFISSREAWGRSRIEVVSSKAEGCFWERDILTNSRLGDSVKPSFDKMMAVELSCAFIAFSCANVEQVEHQPKKINLSRTRKGKAPFFSWRTLHITGENSGKSGRNSGTHAGPRLHFRRGHYRRLGDGRFVWVRHCYVGDKSKGFSGHDYAVRMNPGNSAGDLRSSP